MSLHKELQDLFEQAAEGGGDSAGPAPSGGPRLDALTAAVLRLASRVDELQDAVDNMRARYG